jgi:hypothetical protein
MKTTFEVAFKFANGEYVSKPEVLQMLAHGHYSSADEKHARTKARNAALLEAASYLGADGATEWVVAERLEGAVQRFQRSMWPRIKCGAIFPMTPSDKALKKAFLSRVRIPTTQRRLWDLIRT